MLNKIVKAGSITNLTDARFFAAFDVNYIGFCFDPQSPNYISPQNALAIKGWITGPKIVAEFANQDIDNINNIIQFFEPDIIEVDAEYVEQIIPTAQKFNLPIFARTPKLITINNNVLFYIIPFVEKETIGNLIDKYIFDLSDSSTTNINISTINAIQLKGTPELEVGIKSFDKIAEILESITN